VNRTETSLLADAAERASVAAEWLGGVLTRGNGLNNAWDARSWAVSSTTSWREQPHPKPMSFSWNDDVIAMNPFAGVLYQRHAKRPASAWTLNPKERPLVVYNPLNISREDVVEAAISFYGGDSKKKFVSSHRTARKFPLKSSETNEGVTKILFLAKAPSVGFAVYDVRASDTIIYPLHSK